MTRVAAVLPAAGAGMRLGGAAKQFRILGDAPVLVHAARAVLSSPAVTFLAVAVPAGETDVVRAMLDAFDVAPADGLLIVAGGATRQESVAAAIAALPPDVELVLVHDAARPFLPAHRLEAVIAEASAHGAAALAVPVADTLRRAGTGALHEVVDRAGLWAMQTPQAARAHLLRRAVALAERDGFTGTDEVALLERAGVEVRLVEGDPRNLKVTGAGDWEVAEALWRSGSAGRG